MDLQLAKYLSRCAHIVNLKTSNMKKSFFLLSALVAGIVSISIAQSSSDATTAANSTVKSVSVNLVDTLPKKDTVPGSDTTGKQDSTTKF